MYQSALPQRTKNTPLVDLIPISNTTLPPNVTSEDFTHYCYQIRQVGQTVRAWTAMQMGELYLLFTGSLSTLEVNEALRMFIRLRWIKIQNDTAIWIGPK